jgi:hypothetical protein
MKKIFFTAVLTIYVGLIFVSVEDILQPVLAQLELPQEKVPILNETATNNTISNSTNNTTGMVESAKP